MALAGLPGMNAPTMQLRTPSFRHGGFIPPNHTCDGRGETPELRWDGAPDGTRSFVLLVEDPDAPGGTLTHWVRYDIPADTRELGDDTDGPGLTGTNDFQTEDWRGPCPPPNHGEHRYFFRLYALDVETLDLPEGVRIDEVRERSEGHVLGTSELMGRYRRKTD